MIEERRGLTFAQAEGVERLPSQLALREISPELSARLWFLVRASLKNEIVVDKYSGIYRLLLIGQWGESLRKWWVFRKFQNIDEFPKAETVESFVKGIVTSKDYLEVFDFLQYLMTDGSLGYSFHKSIERALAETRSAYRVVDNYIVPISTDEELDTIRRSLVTIKSAAPQGPYSHLRKATVHLSSGAWSDAIRECITSVESAACLLDESANTLGVALTKLNRKGEISGALKRGFEGLYGFTNSDGIRHALLYSDKSEVSERDAIFFYGACASFVAYLLSSNSAQA